MAVEFNLRHLVREVLRTSTLSDPGLVADEVMKRIPRGAVRVALSQTMRLFVRQVSSEIKTSVPPSATSNRSAKVSAIRDGWQRRLRDRVHCGDGKWKFLAECTYEDLLAAASERRELAERNLAWARQYDEWARLLTEHDVATFGDLPAEAQMAALGRAA